MQPVPAVVRLAARSSPLAMAQAEAVAAGLRAARPGVRVEILPVTARGDRILDRPLSELGGKGAFTKEIDAAVLDGAADAAVHSLKDLPTEPGEGLRLAAVPERESWEDVVAGASGSGLRDLPPGAVLGCGSLRRRAQLLRLRPDLRLEDVRGNIATRLGKIAENGWSGVVMARAALSRLGLDIPCVPLGEEVLPAAGQGALGIVIRNGDRPLGEALREIVHEPTLACVTAERAFWRRLGAGCHSACAVLAEPGEGRRLLLRARLLSPDGRESLDVADAGGFDGAEETGIRAAETALRLAPSWRLAGRHSG